MQFTTASTQSASSSASSINSCSGCSSSLCKPRTFSTLLLTTTTAPHCSEPLRTFAHLSSAALLTTTTLLCSSISFSSPAPASRDFMFTDSSIDLAQFLKGEVSAPVSDLTGVTSKGGSSTSELQHSSAGSGARVVIANPTTSSSHAGTLRMGVTMLQGLGCFAMVASMVASSWRVRIASAASAFLSCSLTFLRVTRACFFSCFSRSTL
mmetsp:Transcript_20110/g.27842  ORF Transcript_20110/g.27842 Transcript_20110/m.27842 type:complete len:209 (-) Transcript_20110:41-667(-)